MYCDSIFDYARRETREIHVGKVAIGGDNPIRVQSMLTNDTRDVDFVTNNTSPSLNAFCDAVGATYVAGWASTYGALGGGSSDHASYNAAGFPATFYFEDTGQYSPHIHTPNDAYPGGVPDFEWCAERAIEDGGPGARREVVANDRSRAVALFDGPEQGR